MVAEDFFKINNDYFNVTYSLFTDHNDHCNSFLIGFLRQRMNTLKVLRPVTISFW